MMDYALYTSPTCLHRITAVSLASQQGRADRQPARSDTVGEMPGPGHERLEEDIVALLPVLQRVACRMTYGPQDAEDLVQDTVTRALTHRHQFRGGSNLRAWLIAIMRSLAVTAYRRKGRAPQMQSLYDCQMEEALYGPGGLHGSPSAEHMMLQTSLDQNLLVALASLPEHFRRAVVLCDVQGLTYQEAAQIMGCALGTVMSRLHRGRTRLRKALAGTDFSRRAGVPARVQRRRSTGGAANSVAASAGRAA